jgi:hypothetical protein
VGDQNNSIIANKVDYFQWNMSEFDGSKGCIIETKVAHAVHFYANRLEGRRDR